MNAQEFKKLLRKLDTEIDQLSGQSSFTNTKKSVTLISENTDIEGMDNNELILTHTMLHMFYNSKNGRDITVSTIEKLHTDISKKLKSHKNYDKLDKK